MALPANATPLEHLGQPNPNPNPNSRKSSLHDCTNPQTGNCSLAGYTGILVGEKGNNLPQHINSFQCCEFLAVADNINSKFYLLSALHTETDCANMRATFADFDVRDIGGH